MAKAAKYHINPETGRPNQCTATVRGCKYAQGDLIPEHYDSKEEAQLAYEKKMNEEQGQTKSLKKPKKISPRASLNKPPKRGSKLPASKKDSPKDSPKASKSYSDEESLEYYKKAETQSIITSAVKDIFDGDYNGAMVSIDEWSEAVEYHGGDWYYSSPAERYHESDRYYRSDPYFEVRNERLFAKETIVDRLNNEYAGIHLPKGYKISEISDEGMEQLRNADYFRGYSYEAVIEGGYYGQEFHGFKLDNFVKEKVTQIITDEIIRQSEKTEDD